MTTTPVDFFERQWQTYRTVVEQDWMEHRGVTAACAAALDGWFDEHPDRRGTARLLDLGCGDLALIAPVLRRLPLGSYVGVDLTEQVLPMARSALGHAPFTAEFRHGDIRSIPGTEPYDLVHACLVLHHLRDEEKRRFLAQLLPRVRTDGAFLWADVFCEPGESLADYRGRYATRIRQGWRALSEDDREAIVTHMNTYDFPAEREAIVAVAAECGWQWRWLWQGTHRAEAVALLTPAQ
jgi:2-polyprenyl-3-methyl-5-hydroxy-6-metoxy-1,4-benzoquinol methylase